MEAILAIKVLQLSDCCREQANKVSRNEVSPCVPKFLYRSQGKESVTFPPRACRTQELHLSTPQSSGLNSLGEEEWENPSSQSRYLSFFCCVSLPPHANENVSTLQCWGTSCRCVSDTQINEWSKEGNPATLGYLFTQ